MNGVIAEYEISRTQILVGDHHIVTGVPVKDAVKSLTVGMLAAKGADGYFPLQADYTDDKPVAVFLENVEGDTNGSIIPAALHGAIRLEKLHFADDSAITEKEVELLRSVGIYAV